MPAVFTPANFQGISVTDTTHAGAFSGNIGYQAASSGTDIMGFFQRFGINGFVFWHRYYLISEGFTEMGSVGLSDAFPFVSGLDV